MSLIDSAPLTEKEFNLALRELSRKLSELKNTANRSDLRNLCEELQLLAFDAKQLCIHGGKWKDYHCRELATDR